MKPNSSDWSTPQSTLLEDLERAFSSDPHAAAMVRARVQATEATVQPTAAHQQACRVAAWFKRHPQLSLQPFIIGSSPDGKTVRLARLFDADRTTLVWCDLSVEVATIAAALERACGWLENAHVEPNNQLQISPEPLDLWQAVAQAMVVEGRVVQGSGRRLFYDKGAGVKAVSGEPLDLADLERWFKLDRIPYCPPELLVDEQPLDLIRLDAAIQAADEAFGP